MPLTDTAIRNAKAKDKPYKLSDGRGLYLLVNKQGKYFRWDYKFGGKRKTFSFGIYPDVKLKEVRERHEDLRGQQTITPNSKPRATYCHAAQIPAQPIFNIPIGKIISSCWPADKTRKINVEVDDGPPDDI